MYSKSVRSAPTLCAYLDGRTLLVTMHPRDDFRTNLRNVGGTGKSMGLRLGNKRGEPNIGLAFRLCALRCPGGRARPLVTRGGRPLRSLENARPDLSGGFFGAKRSGDSEIFAYGCFPLRVFVSFSVARPQFSRWVAHTVLPGRSAGSLRDK